MIEEVFDAARSSPLAPAVPPVLGRTADVAPVSGTVMVELPVRDTFVWLRSAASIPLGTTVDTTHGTVKLTSAKDAHGHTETGLFCSGEFKVTQAQPASAIQNGKRVELTDLTLAGPRPACVAAATASRATAKPEAPRQRKTRRLWGNAHGSYRTIGTNASATVRGTEWLTEDTCNGTLIHVTGGVVSVDDFPHDRSFLLGAPHSFLAPPGRGG